MVDGDLTIAFVGSYAQPDQPGLHVVAIDGAGRASLRGSHVGVHNPSFLTVHPSGRHLYVVSEIGGGQGAVHVFDIEWTGAIPDLAPRGRRSTGGDGPCHLDIDSGGTWLAATNYGSGEVLVFPVRGDGELGERVASVRHTGSGPNPQRQGEPHPHSSAFAPDGRFLVVADLGTDELTTYAVDGASGELSRHEVVRVRPGAGPRLVRFTPTDGLLCVVNELDNTLSLATWDSWGGTLDVVQTVPTVAPGLDEGSLAAGVAFEGSSVFVSSRGDDTVARFHLSGESGLSPVDRFPSGGAWPRAIEVAPRGGALLVANEHSDSLVVLSTDDRGSATAHVPISRPTAIAFARSAG